MSFFKAIWYLLSPPYRDKINRDYGWCMAFKATNHLIASWDQGDMDATRILLKSMRELNTPLEAILYGSNERLLNPLDKRPPGRKVPS